jgi:hypothetical protein
VKLLQRRSPISWRGLGGFVPLELFSLIWGDLKLMHPEHGRPMGIGVIELCLLPETKTNHTKVADIVIAYACASGLILGLWMERQRLSRIRRLFAAAQGIRGPVLFPQTSPLCMAPSNVNKKRSFSACLN